MSEFDIERDPEDLPQDRTADVDRPAGLETQADDLEGVELDIEVPEADAADQRRPAPIDDEERGDGA